MADKLIVGDPNCTFNMVTKAMNNAPNVEDIVDKWRKIAKDLGLKQDAINKIERQILYEKWSALDIIDEILQKWRSSASVNATLVVLLKILKDHGLGDIANEILKAFKLAGLPHDNAQLQPGFFPQLPTNMPQLVPGQVNPIPPQYVTHASYQQMWPQGATGYPGAVIPNIVPPGNMLYKTNAQGQPTNTIEQVNPSAVDSSTDLDDSLIDGVSGSKPSGSQTSPSTITVEDMKTRMLQVPQNTIVSVKIEKQPKREDDFYKLPGIKEGNGYALILNIIRYKKQGYRKGAQYDSFMLTQLFTQLGYKVIKYDDPNAYYTKADVEGIVTLFRDYVKEKNPASVVVFIGCHGRLEEIQLSDESFTSLFNSVVYQFDSKNCSKLNTIPKIFIVEKCRDILHDGPGFKNIFNTIICYATLPGNKAARDENSGTYYIKSLVKVFAEKAHKLPLTELLDLTEGDLWNELIKYGQKMDNRQQSMYVPLGQFKTFYFNL